MIGALGPKWRRATCLPAHFLSSAHTLGLAIAMPAHTHTVWCIQTYTDTKKWCRQYTAHSQTLKSTLACYKPRGQHDWTSCPLSTASLVLTLSISSHSLHKNYTTILSSSQKITNNVKNKSWFLNVNTGSRLFHLLSLAEVWVTVCLPIWLRLSIQVSLFATDLALARTEQKVWRA